VKFEKRLSIQLCTGQWGNCGQGIVPSALWRQVQLGPRC